MVTVRPRIRTGRDGRPATTAVAASAAITDARSTDGSKRVSSANQPMRASVAAQRVGARARRSTGDATARSSATFSPGHRAQVRQAGGAERFDRWRAAGRGRRR